MLGLELAGARMDLQVSVFTGKRIYFLSLWERE
jgi:hypothetical protein